MPGNTIAFVEPVPRSASTAHESLAQTVERLPRKRAAGPRIRSPQDSRRVVSNIPQPSAPEARGRGGKLSGRRYREPAINASQAYRLPLSSERARHGRS